jgi:sugar phosphate isomerase/epimerase
MQFFTAEHPHYRTYTPAAQGYLGEFEQTNANIEQTISIKDIGQSVSEGARFGTFIQTTQNAIRAGAGKIELSTGMGGGQEPVGAEAYGKDARQALREITRVNQVDFVSVHSPAQIGNLSGYNPQERGFSDEHRKYAMEEVKKAIEFAADVGGGAVVVHTGEFQRDISDQPWAKNPDGTYRFLNYQEEPGRAVLYMVDDRTGRMITEVRKSLVVHEPDFKTKYDPIQKRERWVDMHENFIDETDTNALFARVPKWNPEYTRFDTRRLTWDDFVRRAEEWNRVYPKSGAEHWTPEELYFRSQMETRILQARGSSLYHGRTYDSELESYGKIKRALDYFQKIEKDVPKEEQWKLYQEMRGLRGYAGHIADSLVQTDRMLPSEMLTKALKDVEHSMRYTHEASAAADAQAEESIETLKHIVPVEIYAKQQSSRSYAEAGIYAMEQTHHNKMTKKDIFVAPENIFPEMGYGSHPEELIRLVKDARGEMAKLLTSKLIPDPYQKERDKEGKLKMVPNPWYEPGMSEDEAKKESKNHIKATLDTQHLGMWWKHFQPLEGEGKESRKKRFDKWYTDQIERLEKEDILGHIHVVDAMGGSHAHLPVGQGALPVREALEYLKKKGYKGTMISEAYGEESMFGQGRILTEAWRGLGTPIRGYGIGAPQRWGDVQHSYFGATQNPYFVFGSYSPSNDWSLWSQVPME